MKPYTKRPRTVLASLFSLETRAEIIKMLAGRVSSIPDSPNIFYHLSSKIKIPIILDQHYVIQHQNGEITIIQRETFERKYVPIDADSAATKTS